MAEREEALREAQLLSALRHPNIIAYKESFIEDADKTLVIVTAYAEEGDLFTHIKRARESGRRFRRVRRLFTLVPIRPRRRRGARRSLRTLSPGVCFSPPATPRRSQSRHTYATPFNSSN